MCLCVGDGVTWNWEKATSTQHIQHTHITLFHSTSVFLLCYAMRSRDFLGELRPGGSLTPLLCARSTVFMAVRDCERSVYFSCSGGVFCSPREARHEKLLKFRIKPIVCNTYVREWIIVFMYIVGIHFMCKRVWFIAIRSTVDFWGRDLRWISCSIKILNSFLNAFLLNVNWISYVNEALYVHRLHAQTAHRVHNWFGFCFKKWSERGTKCFRFNLSICVSHRRAHILCRFPSLRSIRA